ncbi:GNAT family N-acetyltransferase [Myxosarcina sp. GI1(2024)]
MIQYYNGQFKAVADVFHAAVHETAASSYTQEQVDAWAPTPNSYDHWRARCELKRPFLYTLSEQVVGFIELDSDGHIDCHYVHPEYNRMGIGTTLLLHVIKIATDLQLNRLYVEASHTAKGLYLKHGFNTLSPNQVSIGNVVLENWLMERAIANKSLQRTLLRGATEL